jgi:hypothetical protein
MKRCNSLILTAFLLLFLLGGNCVVLANTTPVTDAHLNSINNSFKQNRIVSGYAELDAYGRVQLKGGYEDDKQVDLAFSLAQTVVGVKWVSPVTPDNIKVKEWEKRIGSLFSRARVLKETGSEGSPGSVRNRYALVVGVGQFKYGIQTLQYTVRDASSFYSFLVNPQGAAFPRSNVYYLTDQTATRDNIMKYLNTIKNAAGPDDLVVVYMSSHGTPPDKFGGVHIVTYDTEVKPRERVWHTAVTENMLKDFVEGLRAKRLVMILDTCYSNGAYRSIPGFLPPAASPSGPTMMKATAYRRTTGKGFSAPRTSCSTRSQRRPRERPRASTPRTVTARCSCQRAAPVRNPGNRTASRTASLPITSSTG